ncbi:conserved hypothetical protein [Magnetococcus marinus MC-1]|uniref:Uncharacterized protein n=1 Tax=Magnetococcus marinus (strain ATCC BAA-1437 / JCM 17883 / MC-1) TaxID=156889 RepID=A0L8D8_MAGMM|nr:hypothetical protein [Magnetococcus marinus]ABK44231.1 conserved hypothetical protein [Magnetococcus marinus MC-1]
MTVQAFAPGPTSSIAVSESSQSVLIGGDGAQVMVTNSGAAVVFIAFGQGSVTASVGDTPILPGSVQVFSRSPRMHTHAAALCAAGQSSHSIYFTSGGGI